MNDTCDVWITERKYAELKNHLFPGDHDEHGAVLRAGIVETGKGLRLLVCDVVCAGPESYGPGQHGYRALDPRFIHRQITTCRDQRVAYLAVHNHDCDDSVGFSVIDMESHERGYPALRDIGKGIPVGALVFGRSAVEADIWLPDGSRIRLGEFRIIGSTMKRLYSSPTTAGEARPAYDRQVKMFGESGQVLLQEATVAVVGLGGIGSLVSEYLARLGVGHLVLIDNDTIEDTNASRVVGATMQDIEGACLKIEIAKRVAQDANAEIKVTSLAKDVADPRAANLVRTCDFVFLCADSMRARLVCNAIAHQFFVPMVQLGAKIGVKDGKLRDAFSAVRQVRPGDGCLWCNGWIDPTQLAVEAKSDEERKAQAYGTEQPNPSVISLNAVAAAHGVNDFLFDFLELREPQDDFRYQHFHFLDNRLARVVPRQTPECPECHKRFGLGDALPLPSVQVSESTSAKIRRPSIGSRIREFFLRLMKTSVG